MYAIEITRWPWIQTSNYLCLVNVCAIPTCQKYTFLKAVFFWRKKRNKPFLQHLETDFTLTLPKIYSLASSVNLPSAVHAVEQPFSKIHWILGYLFIGQMLDSYSFENSATVVFRKVYIWKLFISWHVIKLVSFTITNWVFKLSSVLLEGRVRVENAHGEVRKADENAHALKVLWLGKRGI